MNPIAVLETADQVAAAFPLMHQLRPHLADAAEFVARWRRQSADGYRLAGVWDEDRLVALAGYRIADNLIVGRHLYVDDLVTDAAARSGGYGQRLMDWLKAQTEAAGCTQLVLDTPLTNVLGHRFYYRNGLLARALRFYFPIDGAN
ncbi:GNAT family N-acetyltransferase [Cupriavidus agavae]|uniref:Acetyltransferase (GNAT) family protein n=1 Tax=Cupriavidus agavae TaxID=1001822 RepID=A0A4Q7R9H1_9BURK|nr:GNAT family N-acetyltransferase [Cupriavidus agavae]RZT29621.1 acetyltransferase (GNAT) family protein [Cupriavidus agavae]